ncbi:MAG: hypothetical protein V4484_02250 [Pseudomonadota bacterium]
MLIKSCRAIVLVFVLAVTACAQVSPVSKPIEPVDASLAYVYGNFLIPGGNAAGIELQIQNVPTGQKHVIKFRKDGHIAIGQIPAGKYVINRFIGRSVINQIQRTSDLLDPPFNVEFEVLAGRAYYLGDLEGECGTKYRKERGSGETATAVCWDIQPRADAFKASSQLLAQNYPELRYLPVARAFPLPE